MIFPNFQNCACCEKYFKENERNSFHLVQKYALDIICSSRLAKSVVYLQINALSDWIIGIYLREFTNNEREMSISHEASECGFENLSS